VSDVSENGTLPDCVPNDASLPVRPRDQGELTGSTSAASIEHMLQQVAVGESRLFERPCRDHMEERFFSVWQNTAQYPQSGRMDWRNSVPLVQAPWVGSRNTARIPISAVPLPDVTYNRSTKRLVDFYATGNHAYFLSGRLVRLFDELDPGSLEYLPITIRARDGEVPFYVAMPNRSLSAVDTSRTDVLIKDEDFAGEWLRSVKFPNGMTFRNADLTALLHFTELDAHHWYWSRELVEAAKERGIRGLRTVSVGAATERTIERL
jgi:hypothetical protein